MTYDGFTSQSNNTVPLRPVSLPIICRSCLVKFVARTFDEDIEDDDENMPSSSHDDTSTEEESTEYEGGSSGDDYVERRFQVLFIDDADIPEVV